MKSQKQRKRLKDKLTGICARIVRDRAKNRCERCGHAGVLHAHHPNKKDTIALEYYALGMVALCAETCHPWAENNPDAQKEWYVEKRGIKAWDKLVELRRTTGMTLAEAEEILKKEVVKC